MRQALDDLEAAGLLRAHRRIETAQGPVVRIDGREILCLCSNNYLGLADHPALLRAALPEEGFGAAASRLITGTMDAHEAAERSLAEFVGAPAAALFANGYAANVGTVQALAESSDVVFSDALNHASLIDGCRLSRAAVHVYRHRDLDHLEALLREHRGSARRALILSDSLFSMDGVAASLSDLLRLARAHDAGLLVDEAHSLGVFGPEGRGLCAEAGVVPDALIGTLGKSFGGAGAFVAGEPELVSLIRNRARSYIYSTAPPPALARAAVAGVSLVREAGSRRSQLLHHAGRLRAELSRLGYRVIEGDSHIVPVVIGSNHDTMRMSAELLAKGIFVQGIRPPTVAEGTARLRVTPMATHTDEHIDKAIRAFADLGGTG